ncbi:MAG TPA: hypothetical protein VF532_13585 [Candidatus Angelobacter sp.]
MQRPGRSFVAIACTFVLIAAGCGGSSSPQAQGHFGNGSFSGSYAFVLSGKDASGFFAVAGSLQADGGGHITRGTMDINAAAGVSTSVSFTGSYSVHPNGQGSAQLVSPVRTFNIHFVLVSASRAMLASFDANTTGHGTADLQSLTVLDNSALAGQYAFNLAGVDVGANPLATLGGLVADGAGTIASGVSDASDNGVPSGDQPVTGTYSLAASGRGTMTLTTSLGTLHFAFYPVSNRRFKLVETERSPALAGEATVGSNASVSVPGCGPCVFRLSGIVGGKPFAAAGIFGTDDAGGITPNGFQDINTGAGAASVGISGGSYGFAGNFHGTLSLRNGVTGVLSNYVIYPSADGILFLCVDPGSTVTGVATIQAGAGLPFQDLSFQGAYAFSVSGTVLNGSTDVVGQVSASFTGHPTSTTPGTLTGALDINQAGVLTPNLVLDGSFTLDTNARGTAALHTASGTQNVILYAAGPNSPLYFVGRDAGFVAAGSFDLQQ